MTDNPATARAATGTPPTVHLVVSANPAPDGFDHAIVEAYRATATAHGHTVVVRDLYALDFDPVLKLDERPGHGGGAARADVVEELRYVREAAAIVLVYPIWYGFPPAMLKGYVDRVLGSGYSFRDFHDQKGQATLTGKPLVSFSTSGLPLA